MIPTSVVVKLVAINPTSTASGSCTAAQEGTPVSGMVAYGTTPQPLGTVFNVVEHSFRPSTLSQGPTTGNNEYASITGRCAAILGNGSSFGVCNSCKSGALGAEKQ